MQRYKTIWNCRGVPRLYISGKTFLWVIKKVTEKKIIHINKESPYKT